MIATSTDTVTIGTAAMSARDIVRVANGAPLVLDDGAQARIAASRAVVDELVDGPRLVYGLNTGLGHGRDQRIPLEELRAYQEAVVAGHEGGVGEPLPTAIVRAAIAARVNGIARGGSGASPAVARALVDLLNSRIHPVVPTVGSVGASDLMHLAAVGLVILGQGRAEHRGEVLPGGEALARAGLAPIILEPKDGLALISANAVSIGHGALVAARAYDIADVADLVVAMSMEAIRGNPSIVDPIVAAEKGVRGQAESAARIRRYLAGSDRCVEGGAASVQDPLSFRVAPQVHGALREVVRRLDDSVEQELNAVDDNPLVDVERRRLVSNGNFHPMLLALDVDAVRPALAHVAMLSDRRMNHLWMRLFADPSTMSVAGFAAAADRGGPLMRYSGAAITAELRDLANPVTLDVGALDLGVEDHATNAPLAVRHTGIALERLADVLAIELAMARSTLHIGADPGRLGDGVAAACEEFDAIHDPLGQRPPTADLHRAISDALVSRLLAAADRGIGAERP